MNTLARICLAAGLLLPTLTSAAKVGDVLPALTLKDQIGNPHTLDASTKRIYANADRKGDALMKAARIQQQQLDKQKAIVVADISEAPSFVKRIITGSLKDRLYTTWLDVKGSTQKSLAYSADKVTVIELDNLRITAIRSVADTAALQKELAQP